MNKKKKYILLFLMICLLFTFFGCKKQEKVKWHEVGAPEVPKVEHFGVQYTKGTESNPAKVFVASIYIPIGRDKKGKSQFQTIMYELEELTPEGLNQALIDCGVLTEDVLFVDFTTEKTDNVKEMGPGGNGKKKDLEGLVRYVELDSVLENSDEYIDAATGEYYNDERIEGLIDFDDLMNAVNMTFEENYQLADCYYQPANMQDYKDAHKE